MSATAGVPPYLEREVLINAALEADSRIVVLAAGSGMGKSNLLADVQRRCEGSAPEPTLLLRSAGSLQAGVMSQLALALAPRIKTAAMQEVVVAATKRFLKDRKSELGRVVAKEFLNLLKARLGEGVGETIAEYVADLKVSYEERLEERLATMADPGVLGEIIGLMTEVVAALDSQRRSRWPWTTWPISVIPTSTSRWTSSGGFQTESRSRPLTPQTEAPIIA
jgi:hypothetical protein